MTDKQNKTIEIMKTTNFLGNFSQEGKSMVDSMLHGMSPASYEAPVTTRNVVETEGSFCGSVIEDNPGSSDVKTTNQQVQTDYYETPAGGSKPENPFDFSEDNWD